MDLKGCEWILMDFDGFGKFERIWLKLDRFEGICWDLDEFE